MLMPFCPDAIHGRAPLDWSVPRRGLVARFRNTLGNARDEKPMQKFFEKNPVALATGVVRPHQVWVFSRPALPKPEGGAWIPDFLVCEWSSIGPSWVIVELKSPTVSPITGRGISAAFQRCRQAGQRL
jgi:hypothetical protein